MVEISFHSRSMNTEYGLVLSSRRDLSFTPTKIEQSLLAGMHNWNIMAPFTATHILNLCCFSSLFGPLQGQSHPHVPLIYSITSVHHPHVIPSPILVLTLFLHVSCKPNLLYIATLPLAQYLHCISLYLIPFF